MVISFIPLFRALLSVVDPLEARRGFEMTAVEVPMELVAGIVKLPGMR